ncbi:hypothetical protein M434DRAFT_74214, partial [Hypoxylon sp. CO27-5]
NHAINLKKGKKPPFNLIYLLVKKELKILKEYINNTLKKGWIKLLKSITGLLILFIPKLKEKL